MNSSFPNQHGLSTFRRPVFWAAFAAISLGCAVFAFSNADRAFSIVELDLRMDRDAALAEARRLAEGLDLGPADFRQAASFRVDDSSRSFVELEGGGAEAFADLIREGPYRPYQWIVRHFREGDPRQLEVRFLPDGTPYGYRERLAENTPGEALDAIAARAIAESGAGDPWNVDLTDYELVQSSRQEQPSGRVDHTFIYEHIDRQAGEGRFRLTLTVSGDRLTQLTHFLRIPEGFDRRYEAMRSVNNGIANGALLAAALLYGVGAVVGLFLLLRRRRVLWRMAAVCGATVSILQALAAFNGWPLIWMDYDTSVSESSFAIRQIVTTLSSTAIFAIMLTLSLIAAESLSRWAFPHHAQFWRIWSRDGARSWSIAGQTAAGYLAAGAMLAYVVAFYWVAGLRFGWWSPSDALHQPDSVATALPWLNPLAISLQAGLWEECLFRAIPLAGAALLGERFGRRGAWIAAAFVLQILIFGAAHANYPAQPAYARLVELILPSAAFGLLYLRFGLLPAIIMHFAFDAVLFSMPLFLSTASGAWIDQGLFVVIFLLPVWVVLAARYRGGAWIEAPTQLANGAWQPSGAESLATPTGAAPPPRLALPRVPVSAAIALAGLVLWGYASVEPAESPPLGISRGEAYEIAREALAANGVDADDWRESAVFLGGAGPDHRFVWNEAGPEAFRTVPDSYLASLFWHVRYARFEGDVAARAEEYIVKVDGKGAVESFQHRPAEHTEGLSLEEADARAIARDALTRLGVTSEFVEVSAHSARRPARTDWYFTFRDESVGDLAGGEARAQVEIAGDEVVDILRFLFLPEQWRREDNQRRDSLSTAQSTSGIVLSMLLVAGVAAAVGFWSRGRFNARAALMIGGLWLALRVIGEANVLPVTVFGLSTAQSLPLQLAMHFATTLVGIGILAAGLGLIAGYVHSVSPGSQPPDKTAAVWSGLALGLGFLGATTLAGAFSANPPLPWSSFSGASTAIPWLGTAIAPIREFIAVTVISLLIVLSANSLAEHDSRLRIPAAVGVCLVGVFFVPGSAPDDIFSWWFVGAVSGGMLLAGYLWILQTYPALLVPAVAALSIPPVLASGFERAYDGALIGSLLAAACILVLSWRWFNRLTVEKQTHCRSR